MKSNERDLRRERTRKLLTTALFVLDTSPEVAMVQTVRAVHEFAGWVDAERVKKTMREMTDDGEQS